MGSNLSQSAIDEILKKNSINQENTQTLSTAEIDTIGEILNISMGAGATAMSTLLGMKVVITTPIVSVIKAEEFSCASLDPALGVQIEYTEGLSGTNILIMKQDDIKVIVDILMGGDGSHIADELDEMHTSAISEMMNQMMGSSCTALASFFGKNINISIPNAYPIESNHNFEGSFFDHAEQIVQIVFRITVGNLINSEMISTVPVDFAKELVAMALHYSTNDTSDEGEAITGEPEAPVQMPLGTNDDRVRSREAEAGGEPRYAPVNSQSGSGAVSVRPVSFSSFDDEDQAEPNPKSVPVNLGLILDVPLEISVQIGRTKRPVKEILEFAQGSIVELDKQAGDPVDIIVNGQLIAKGNVVVIDDNFGVRITEIVSKKDRITKINR